MWDVHFGTYGVRDEPIDERTFPLPDITLRWPADHRRQPKRRPRTDRGRRDELSGHGVPI